MVSLSVYIIISIFVIVSFIAAVHFSIVSLGDESHDIPELVKSDLASFHLKNHMMNVAGLVESAENTYDNSKPELIMNHLIPPGREENTKEVLDPPTLDEVKSNLTWYLRTLDDRFKELASPRVSLKWPINCISGCASYIHVMRLVLY